MKKIAILGLFLVVQLLAKTDYSEMSTEELLAMMGYVSPQNQKSLHKELKERQEDMSKKEKALYEKNLKKMEKK